MKNFFIHLFYFLFFLFFLTIERGIGLPILSVLFAVLQLLLLEDYSRVFMIILMTVAISVVYVLPFWVVALLLVALITVAESQQIFLGIVGVIGVIGLLLHYPFTGWSIVSVGVSFALVFLFLRFFFQFRRKKGILSISKRFTTRE